MKGFRAQYTRAVADLGWDFLVDLSQSPIPLLGFLLMTAHKLLGFSKATVFHLIFSFYLGACLPQFLHVEFKNIGRSYLGKNM